jgi:mitogen-activated protein kinase kinase kinase
LIIGFESTSDSVNVFLEYVAGGSISSCISKCGKFSEEVSQSCTGQILCGLEYLHGCDIIHRDIKVNL